MSTAVRLHVVLSNCPLASSEEIVTVPVGVLGLGLASETVTVQLELPPAGSEAGLQATVVTAACELTVSPVVPELVTNPGSATYVAVIVVGTMISPLMGG